MHKTIRKILLKIQCIEQAAFAHQAQLDEQRYHEHWAALLRSSNTVRDGDVLIVSTNEELHVDYLDSRMVGQRAVAPVFIDSVQWGGMKL